MDSKWLLSFVVFAFFVADLSGDETSTKKNQEDLEAAIRLARMDLSELQGLPLPSQ